MTRPSVDFSDPRRFDQMRAMFKTSPRYVAPLSWRDRVGEGVTFLGLCLAVVVAGLLLMGAL